MRTRPPTRPRARQFVDHPIEVVLGRWFEKVWPVKRLDEVDAAHHSYRAHRQYSNVWRQWWDAPPSKDGWFAPQQARPR